MLPTWAVSPDGLADALDGLVVLYERRCKLLLGMHKQAMTDCVANTRAGKAPRDCAAWPLDRPAFQHLYIKRITRSSEPRPFRVAATTNFDSVVSSVIDAFGTLEFTVEADCVIGALSHIAHEHFGQTLEATDLGPASGLLKFLWQQQMDVRGFHGSPVCGGR